MRTRGKLKSVVVIGQLDPLLRAAFLQAARDRFAVVEVLGSMARIRGLGSCNSIAAIVLPRRDAADGDPADSKTPWIGLSSATQDVLVISEHGVAHLDNPTAETICDYIGAPRR